MLVICRGKGVSVLRAQPLLSPFHVLNVMCRCARLFACSGADCTASNRERSRTLVLAPLTNECR